MTEKEERLWRIIEARRVVDACLLQDAMPDLGMVLAAGGMVGWQARVVRNAVLMQTPAEEFLKAVIKGKKGLKAESKKLLKQYESGYSCEQEKGNSREKSKRRKRSGQEGNG